MALFLVLFARFLLLLILLANLIPFLSNALWLNFSVAQSHMFRNRLFLLCVLQFLKLAELYPHFSSLMVNAFWLWGSYFSPEALHEPRIASWASDSISLSFNQPFSLSRSLQYPSHSDIWVLQNVNNIQVPKLIHHPIRLTIGWASSVPGRPLQKQKSINSISCFLS